MPISFPQIVAVAHQAASSDVLAQGINAWRPLTGRKADYLFAPAYEKRIAGNNHGSNLLLSECRERRIDLSFGACIYNDELEIKLTGGILRIGSLRGFLRITWVGQEPYGRNVGNDIVKERQALPGQISTKPTHAGDVSFLSVQLATMPAFTGSAPKVNTIGTVFVAALAASAEGPPPVAAMTAT